MNKATDKLHNALLSKETRLVREHFRLGKLVCFGVHLSSSIKYTQDNLLMYIPLTNRVRGPYRKLRTEFFLPRFMAQARSARAINRRG